MNYYILSVGLFLTCADIFLVKKTLRANILHRIICILLGVIALVFINKHYLYITGKAVIFGFAVGLVFMSGHILAAGGIKLKKTDLNKGLLFTCALIYFLELPAEEFLYRGIIFVPLLKIAGPYFAIIFSSLLFLLLHTKTHKNKLIWVGSLVMGVVAAAGVYCTGSIWCAVIIHNLNNIGFLTLVNKRNIFKK